MRRLYGVSALILAAAAAIAAATIGGHGTLETVAVLAVIGGASLVAAQAVVLARSRGRAGPLSRQFAFAAAIVIAPLLLALVVIGLLMFASSHDVELVGLIVVFVGVIAVVAGQRLAAAIMHDVEAVRDGLAAVGRGERKLRISTAGSDELGELADAGQRAAHLIGGEQVALHGEGEPALDLGLGWSVLHLAPEVEQQVLQLARAERGLPRGSGEEGIQLGGGIHRLRSYGLACPMSDPGPAPGPVSSAACRRSPRWSSLPLGARPRVATWSTVRGAL